MEFRLDDDQLALQDTVRRFAADRFALDRIAEREVQPLDRSTWAALGELGVFGLLLPELADESVYGAVGGVIVFEELGSHLATGPLVWSVLAAAAVAPVLDAEALARGEVVVGGLVRSATDAGATPIEHAASLDALLVVGRDGVGVVPGDRLPPVTELVPLDPLTPVGSYERLPAVESVGGPEVAARTEGMGATLTAALAVGVSARALETARAHALEREQFGVPIGSFQAIKHLLADMYVRTNLARSATYAAAAVADDTSADPAAAERALAGAKLLACGAALDNARSAVQILGGMGFTWEMLPNYLLKRAWVLEHGFGTGSRHALAIADALGSGVA